MSAPVDVCIKTEGKRVWSLHFCCTRRRFSLTWNDISTATSLFLVSEQSNFHCICHSCCFNWFISKQSYPALATCLNNVVQIISDWFVCVYLSVFLLSSPSSPERHSGASTQTPYDTYDTTIAFFRRTVTQTPPEHTQTPFYFWQKDVSILLLLVIENEKWPTNQREKCSKWHLMLPSFVASHHFWIIVRHTHTHTQSEGQTYSISVCSHCLSRTLWQQTPGRLEFRHWHL